MPSDEALTSQAFSLFIDESGSRNPDHEPGVDRKDRMDCFALGGVLIQDEDIENALNEHKCFCSHWGISTPLHSTLIRRRAKEFSWLAKDAEKADRFLSDLTTFIVNLPIVIIACVIHRPGYNARYAAKYGEYRWMLCKTAYAVLIERSAKFSDENGRSLKVFFAQSGKREDRNLLAYHKLLKREGMPFDAGSSGGYEPLGAKDFQRIVLGDPERRTNRTSLCQVADLVLYPVAKGKYDPSYRPYVALRSAGKLIDCHLAPQDRERYGIKYSCFDDWPD